MVKNRVVYSTDMGDHRNRPVPSTDRSQSLPPAQQNIKLSRDKKGRKGKVVTVAAGFGLTEADLVMLAKTLKTLAARRHDQNRWG
jgi:Translation initiation factor SUI1.